MENRVVEINNLITKIALNNDNISASQIARARAIYQYDSRPIEEIEKELLEYSEMIKKESEEISPITDAPSIKEEANDIEILQLDDPVQLAMPAQQDEEKTLEQPHPRIKPDTSPELVLPVIPQPYMPELEESEIPLSDGIKEVIPPVIETEGSVNSVNDNVNDNIGITQVNQNEFIPSSYIPDTSTLDNSSSQNELDAMFATYTTPTSKRKLTEKTKQYVKTPHFTPEEAGYSSSITLLVTAGIVSIITIVFSLIILIY